MLWSSHRVRLVPSLELELSYASATELTIHFRTRKTHCWKAKLTITRHVEASIYRRHSPCSGLLRKLWKTSKVNLGSLFLTKVHIMNCRDWQRGSRGGWKGVDPTGHRNISSRNARFLPPPPKKYPEEQPMLWFISPEWTPWSDGMSQFCHPSAMNLTLHSNQTVFQQSASIGRILPAT